MLRERIVDDFKMTRAVKRGVKCRHKQRGWYLAKRR